jgi:hypothetical protein
MIFALRVLDHNVVLVPYLAADEAVTMDPLWRGEESATRGEHSLTMSPASCKMTNRRCSRTMDH